MRQPPKNVSPALIQALKQLEARILNACELYSAPNKPRLLAVSKKQSVEKMRGLYQLGVHNFGENYVQEALDKMQELEDLAICWHFIGPLQSNKSKLVAENFHWVHSVDSLKLATRLNQQRPSELAPLNICLQINIDDEASKSGIAIAEAETLADSVLQLPNLRLRGLMCIPKSQQLSQDTQRSFRALADLRRSLEAKLAISLDTLSMGMSEDLEWAIAEGATMIRIGTALFGSRH